MGYDVTIGIPVYKSADYIRRSLESALAQSYSSIEFLIVDDVGSDGSMDIVETFRRTHFRGIDIHIINHKNNMGVSASRNEIIDRAQGNYLYFMDSDDIISENAIELLMQSICHYNAEIAFGSYEKIETNGTKNVYQYPALKLLKQDELASFAYRKYAGIQASACNYLVKTSILRDNHHYFIDANYWEDFVYTFDLVTLVSRAVLLSDITYSYICRENSLSNYQQRETISKAEIIQNVKSINHLKRTSVLLCNKNYFPNRCFNIAMTDFYIVCNILKNRDRIVPFVSNREVKSIMKHPVSFIQICRFRHSFIKNMMLYILGILPAFLSFFLVRFIGKVKKLI